MSGDTGRNFAAGLIAAAGIRSGQRVLDVGCGPGPLTTALAELLGAESVVAIDPSEAFVKACRARVPGADVRVGAGEQLPFADDKFDAVLAQLVVQLMDDRYAGVREMARVARPGGVVAAFVWDSTTMRPCCVPSRMPRSKSRPIVPPRSTTAGASDTSAGKSSPSCGKRVGCARYRRASGWYTPTTRASTTCSGHSRPEPDTPVPVTRPSPSRSATPPGGDTPTARRAERALHPHGPGVVGARASPGSLTAPASRASLLLATPGNRRSHRWRA
jgi:ubiquinone/menaquinone biosynthesis C-methylase UbiE